MATSKEGTLSPKLQTGGTDKPVDDLVKAVPSSAERHAAGLADIRVHLAAVV